MLSSRFMVQVFEPTEGNVGRLTINRVKRDNAVGSWTDGITWDELQRLKAEAGFGDAWAVEVYPPDADLVDVASMRHLWLLADRPPFGWTRRRGVTP